MKRRFALFFFLAVFILSSRGAYAQLPAIKSVVETIIGSPETSGPTVPSCPAGNYLSCLKNQFGINMHGSYSSSDLEKIYKGFAIGFKYPTFLRWFKSVTPDVTVSSYNVCPANMWCGGAWATVETGAKMTLYQNFLNSGAAYRNYILIHEAAHMAIQASSKASNTQYILYENAYTKGTNRNCYNGKGVIDTYSINIIPSSQLNFARKVRESWAESVADTVLCKSGSTCPSHGGGGTSISSFPTTCSYIYNFVKGTLD